MHALKERGLGHVARLCSVEMSAPNCLCLIKLVFFYINTFYLFS